MQLRIATLTELVKTRPRMDLSSDENDVMAYLKSWKQQFVSMKEICRRAAGKRRAEEDPRWASRILPHMVEKGLIETDSLGHYRLREEETTKAAARKRKKWVSPQIEKILKASGKKFDALDETEPEKE